MEGFSPGFYKNTKISAVLSIGYEINILEKGLFFDLVIRIINFTKAVVRSGRSML